MTTYYEVLRPVEQSDLDAHPGYADMLALVPPRGHATSELFRHAGKDRASKGIACACSLGILKRVSPHARILQLDSVRFWCTQFNESGHVNTAPRHSTRELYLSAVSKFDEWMVGRPFPSRSDSSSGKRAIMKSFKNIEELKEYCDVADYGSRTAKRAVLEYLASPQVGAISASAQTIARSAIKSYFNTHDINLGLPSPKRRRGGPACDDDDPMTIADFYKMMQNGKPSITARAVMMIKFQSGMDSATFADRFNYDGYPQIVRHFKTEDHGSWNLDTCPVPIKTVRVKTDMRYMTFIDRDAVTQLQEYLTWKEAKYGKQDVSKPLFLTKQKKPIHSAWVSKCFSVAAVRAGIQKKVSHRVYKIRSHEVRDLLKSTLISDGCAQYAAEHILGHAPRDSYEKQAILYPEKLRAEYARASASLNIFSKMESTLNSPVDPESQDERIRELEAQIKALTQTNTEKDLMKILYTNAMNEMNEKINRLARLLDKLPDDVKEKMPDEFDGAAYPPERGLGLL